MISIIVPVYKVEPYLRQCVDSILNQTYRDIEVLLIDDGSPDRCGEMCEEYARKDQRIRVFHTENRGLSAARNLGLREATGDYIGFVDSDDWIEPDMYEVLLKRLEETGADISVCGVWYEYLTKSNESACIESVYGSDEAIYALICGDLKNIVMNKLWRHKIIKQYVFPEGRVYEDIFIVYKVFLMTSKIATVQKALYRYRLRKSSIAHTNCMKYLIDYWDSIHERYEFFILHYGSIIGEKLEIGLRKQCAYAIAKTWRWFYSVPREERNYAFLNELNRFSTKTFSLWGDREWPIALRICIFLSHFMTPLSLRCAYVLNRLIWIIKTGYLLYE